MYIMVAHTYFDPITDKGVIINLKKTKFTSAIPVQIQRVNSAHPLTGN